MKKQNLQKLAKAITLSLVLGTALTTAQPVWAETTVVKDGSNNTVFTYDTDTHAIKWGFGSTTASGQGATAFGQDTAAIFQGATAFGQDTVAIGKAATAFGQGTVAIGQGATAFGSTTTASGKYSTAFGYGSKAGGIGATAWGGYLDVDNNVAGSYAKGNSSTAFGLSSKAGGRNSLAALGGTTGVWNAATTPEYLSGGENAVAIGECAEAKADNSVAIGQYAVTSFSAIKDTTKKTVVNEFAVGGGKDGNGNTYYSRITGVADGVDAHDAATYGQLTSMGQELNSQIDRMGTRIDKVGAGAAALAAMHPVYDEDSKLTFSAGLGAYRGEQAAAVGMFYRFTDRVMMNAGATVGNNDNMYNVGLNFAFDRNVGSKLPSKAVMAKQLNAQNERIDALTAENQDMKKEIAELKAMVQALIANK